MYELRYVFSVCGDRAISALDHCRQCYVILFCIVGSIMFTSLIRVSESSFDGTLYQFLNVFYALCVMNIFEIRSFLLIAEIGKYNHIVVHYIRCRNFVWFSINEQNLAFHSLLNLLRQETEYNIRETFL